MADPFKPPNAPPSHTGSLWLNPDRTIGGLISDVWNQPIHLIATKEGAQYRVQGWRGAEPEFRRIPLLDDPRPDGLPDAGFVSGDRHVTLSEQTPAEPRRGGGFAGG